MTTTPEAPPATRPVEVAPAGAHPIPEPDPMAAPHRARNLGIAGAVYLVVSLGLWWHVWTAHPTTTTTCGCGDSSLFTWFLEWPAYAISHGLDPWYSTALFHPAGINLLSNTAVVAIGLVLVPVTWLFGPIATFNVALGLAPVLSALAAFVLLGRYVRWAPAAFVGGLLYGFSPFILIGLTDGHLMLSMSPIPPLLVLCLDELLARQRRNPVATGVLLAVLATVQFFIGTEVLILVGIAAAIGVAVVLVYALAHRDVLVRRGRHAVVGLATAATAGVALLAYPVWFALDGPAHLSGEIWGTPLTSYGGTNVHDYALPAAPSVAAADLAHRFGGYQAPSLSGQYLGIGLLAVLAVGLVVFRRDLRLWLFAAVGAVSVALSSGLGLHGWSLWRVFVRLPLMDNIIPSRFLLVTYLCAAVMLGMIVDHVHSAVRSRAGSGPDFGHARETAAPARRPAGLPAGLLACLAAMAVAAAALAPIAAYDAGGVPLTTQAVVLPAWFRTDAPHLGPGAVVLAFPVPWYLFQSSMTWQAVDRMAFSQVGGGGPESIPSRAGPERQGQAYIGNVSVSEGSPAIDAQGVLVTRQALDGWGVTSVVAPDPAGLPRYERLHAVRSTVVLMTAATGTLPVRQSDAWVWTAVTRRRPSPASSARLAACGRGPEDASIASIEQSAACVLATPGPGR